MARHNDFGAMGEKIAAGWLIERGFSILQRNWRHGRGEVDIIAIKQKIYHFIEIKCSRRRTYGFPEERVGKAKLRNIMKAAAHWLYLHHIPAGVRVQYDVLAIYLTTDGPEYLFIEDISL